MREKSALQVVLERLKEVLEISEEKTIPTSPLPTGVKERVADLEKVVSEFTDLSEKLLRKMGATAQEIAPTSKQNNFLQEQDLATLQLGNELAQRARRKYSQLSFILRAVKSRGQINLNTGKETFLGKARRKKFHRIGGKDHWKPL